MQFRFRNFRDLRVYRIGWDSGKGWAPGAGRMGLRSFRRWSEAAHSPWCPLCCLLGSRAPATPGSGTSGPALAPWLQRVPSPRRVLSAPAAHSRLIEPTGGKLSRMPADRVRIQTHRRRLLPSLIPPPSHPCQGTRGTDWRVCTRQMDPGFTR